MLYQIVSLLLDVAASLVAGTCLLRLYMQFQRIPLSARSGNPVGRFVFALTDWAVLPLRRVVPALGRVDMASLVAAFLVELLQYALLWTINGAEASVLAVLVIAAFSVLRVILTGLTGMVIVFALLSWVQTYNPLSDLLERLVAPLLAPIRRFVPLVGGIDLSPLVLLVLLQVAMIVLGNLQGYVLLAAAAI